MTSKCTLCKNIEYCEEYSKLNDNEEIKECDEFEYDDIEAIKQRIDALEQKFQEKYTKLEMRLQKLEEIHRMELTAELIRNLPRTRRGPCF